MFRAMKGALASAAAVLLVLGLGAGYYYVSSPGGNATSSSKRITGNGAPIVVESVINSSSACTPGHYWENTTAMNTLRSDLMLQATYMESAQNRSYTDGGYGCSLVGGTQFTVIFSYSDLARPFYVCGNSTAYPFFQIRALIYLLPTGYDLSKTSYSTRYYDSQNLTVTCTTTIAH